MKTNSHDAAKQSAPAAVSASNASVQEGKPRGWFSLFLALLGAMALAASFAPWNIWPLAILGITLVMLALLRHSYAANAFIAFAAGTSFFALHFPWIDTATSVPGSFLALAGIESLAWVGFALSFTFVRRIWKRPFVLACAAGCLWVVFEDARSSWPWSGMPWGQLAFSQVNGPLARLAPWGSTFLVSFAVVFLGALVACALRALARGNTLRSIFLVVPAGLALVLTAFVPCGQPVRGYLTVALIQGEVPSEAAIPDFSQRSFALTQNLAKLTRELLERTKEKPDVILWPESASDRDIRTDEAVRALVNPLLKDFGVPIILGTQEYVDDYRYNDVIVWTGRGEVAARYSKQRPVPFGEYLPERQLLEKYLPGVDAIAVDMKAGQGHAWIDLPLREGASIRAATPICFEIAFGDIVTQAVRDGASVVIVPTNNASFGRSAQSAQQLDIAHFRALETGRAVVEVSNVGPSGVIESNGVVRAKTEHFDSLAQIVRVPLSTGTTFASRWWPLLRILNYFCAGLILVLATASRIRRNSHASVDRNPDV